MVQNGCAAYVETKGIVGDLRAFSSFLYVFPEF